MLKEAAQALYTTQTTFACQSSQKGSSLDLDSIGLFPLQYTGSQ